MRIFCDMNKTLMLEQLISHYTGGNKAQFAKLLGVKPQTINSWILRNTYDAELIYAKCDGVSGDWLLSGDGEMLKLPTHIANTVLLDLCKSLVANYQQRKDVMAQLVSIITKYELNK